MIYMLTKAAHLVSLFVWIGGMVAVALSLRHPALPFLQQIKVYDRVVTSPAMVAGWIFGILLAIQGGWFAQSWLAIKIPLVLILSGIHGVLAGKLRRATSGASEPEANVQFLLRLGLLVVMLIVLVVTFKPRLTERLLLADRTCSEYSKSGDLNDCFVYRKPTDKEITSNRLFRSGIYNCRIYFL